MSTAPSPAAPPTEPIGRTELAAKLRGITRAASEGAKRAALLLGPAGIGKTTLLRWAQGHAAEEGLLTAYVRAPAAAGLPPRFPIGELLEGLIHSCQRSGVEIPDPLQRVHDTLRGATTAETYPAALPQIAQALEATAARAPLALFLDDYQWAPAEGTSLLMAALRVIDAPLLFVAAARLRAHGDSPPSPLPEPTADLWIDYMEVGGLETEGVAELAAALLGAPLLPSATQHLSARSQGNPLFVAETIRHWETAGMVSAVGRFVDAHVEVIGQLPRSLHQLIASRLSALPPPAVEVAGTLVALSRPARLEELHEILGGDPGDLARLLDDLQGAGVVELVPSREYRLHHPLYEKVLRELLGLSQLALLHSRIFEASCMRPWLVKGHAELAHHAVSGVRRPANIHALLSLAAEEAEAAGSNERASHWYRLLLNETRDSRARFELLGRLARVMLSFDSAESITLLTEALTLAETPMETASVLGDRAHAKRIAGDFKGALLDLEAALPRADHLLRQSLRHSLAVLCGISGDTDRAETLLMALRRSRDPEIRTKAVGHLGQVSFSRGNIDAALVQWEAAFESTADEAYRADMATNVAWGHILLGHWHHARNLLNEAIASAAQRGDAWNTTALLAILSRLDAWEGRFADSIDIARKSFAVARTMANPSCRIDALDALGTGLLEAGDPNAAVDVFRQIDALITPDLEPRELGSTLATAAEAQLHAGDVVAARASLERAEAQLNYASFWRVAVSRVRAEVLLQTSGPHAAFLELEPWLQASSPVALERARVLELAAKLSLHLHGVAGSWLELADAAIDEYRALGRPHHLEQVTAWRVRTATRRGRRSRRGPQDLTPRELDVLRLLARGSSNKAIAKQLSLAPGTVKKHVERILMKAGVQRRAELPRRTVELGLEELLSPREPREAPPRSR